MASIWGSVLIARGRLPLADTPLLNFEAYHGDVIVSYSASAPLILKEFCGLRLVVVSQNIGKIVLLEAFEIPRGRGIGNEQEYVVVLAVAGIDHQRVGTGFIKNRVRSHEQGRTVEACRI